MCSIRASRSCPLNTQPAWACGNSLTLTTILRGQWDFRGFVLSDYGGTHSTDSLLAGLDQEYPNAAGGFSGNYFSPDVLKPLVDPSSPTYSFLYASALDTAVARVLYQFERFGLLDGGVGIAGPRPTSPTSRAPTRRDRAARRGGLVLLATRARRCRWASASSLRRGDRPDGPPADGRREPGRALPWLPRP